jgi:hypothetical protein
MALCPHCHHAVPDEDASSCPNCGADPRSAAVPPPLDPSAGAAVPPPGGGPGAASIPWEDRGRTGLLPALFETTRDVLARPGDFFRAMPLSGGLGSPLLYAVLVGWAGLVAAALYQAVFRSVVGPGWGGFGAADRPEVARALAWIEGWGGFVAQAVFGGVFVVLGVFLAAGILHLMLLLLGGAKRDFEATFRVVSFSQATSILLLVPFCGQLVALAWCLVLYVIGLSQAHGIGGGRAAAAVLLPLALLCCCCAALSFLFAGAIAGLAGQLR